MVALVAELEALVSRWQALVETTNTAEDAGFIQTTQELNAKLTVVEKQLGMFEGAVTIIEKGREKFPHVSDRELTTRKDIVFGLKQRWLTAKTTVNSRKVQGKIDADRRAALTAREERDKSALPSRVEAANSKFIANQQQAQMQLGQERDVVLTDISESLTVLGQRATGIHDELVDQTHMMTDIGTRVDKTQAQMNGVMRQLGKLLKTNDKCQMYTIIILIIVLVIITMFALI